MPTYADNRKALYDYEILEKSEAGIKLSGQETKSIKNGQISLKGAYITFRGDSAYLTNARISPYKPAGKLPDYEPDHSRQLLLHKREIAYLRGKAQEKGLTIIPISVYNKGRFIKVQIAIVKGKHTYDKREAIKKREAQIEIKRALKDR